MDKKILWKVKDSHWNKSIELRRKKETDGHINYRFAMIDTNDDFSGQYIPTSDLENLRDKLNELFPTIEREAARKAVSGISQMVQEELLKENAELEKFNGKLKREIEAFYERSEKVIEQRNEGTKKITALEKTLENCRKTLHNQDIEVEKRGGAIANLQVELRDSRDHGNCSAARVSQLTKDNERLRKQLDDADRHCSRTEERCSQLFEQVENLQKSYEQPKIIWKEPNDLTVYYRKLFEDVHDDRNKLKAVNFEQEKETDRLKLTNKNLLSLISGEGKKVRVIRIDLLKQLRRQVDQLTAKLIDLE